MIPNALLLPSCHLYLPHRRRQGRSVFIFTTSNFQGAQASREQIPDETYTYDSNGNRISKQNSTHRELYTWDYRNRLTKVTKQEWDSVEETWATVQIDNGTTHHYLWTPQTQDKLIADTTATAVLWTFTDHLGTVRDLLSNSLSGIITQAHIIYDAYGNVISCTDSTGQTIPNPILFGYTGKAFDVSTQLQNNINRWYDPAVGRWLCIDPIGFNGNDTNLYRYVCNLPVGFGDPSGFVSVSDIISSINKGGMSHSGSFSFGPWIPAPTYPFFSVSVSVNFSMTTEICHNGCEELEYTTISVSISGTARHGTRIPGIPRAKGKTKAQQKSNSAQIKKVRRENAGSMEGKLRGIMLGKSDCPDEGLDVSGSATLAFFAGIFYGKEGYVTFLIDDLRQPLSVTGVEVGSNNVFGRTGVELSFTITIAVTGVIYS